MNIQLIPTRFVIITLGLVSATLPLNSLAQGTASATLEDSLSGSGLVGGYAPVTNLSSSHQEAGMDESSYDGHWRARGFAVTGVVGANAQITFQHGNPNSGYLLASANGRWQDAIDLVLPERFDLSDVGYYILDYNVGATGSISAASAKNADGQDVATGGASIAYTFNFGSKEYTGSQSYNSYDGAQPTTGTWGTIPGTVQVAAGDSIGLRMTGTASASMGNFYASGERNVTANADFGSTLIWGGITHVTAFNVSGQQIVLPDDFQLDLIGRQSGFNYWNAAVHPDAPVDVPGVPDSAPAMLMLAPAMLGLALIHRRRQRGAFSS